MSGIEDHGIKYVSPLAAYPLGGSDCIEPPDCGNGAPPLDYSFADGNFPGFGDMYGITQIGQVAAYGSNPYAPNGVINPNLYNLLFGPANQTILGFGFDFNPYALGVQKALLKCWAQLGGALSGTLALAAKLMKNPSTPVVYNLSKKFFSTPRNAVTIETIGGYLSDIGLELGAAGLIAAASGTVAVVTVLAVVAFCIANGY